MATVDKIIRVAQAEVGYLEKASNKDLNSKSANIGKANYTKYGAWYGLNPAYWCAMFVCWCFAQAYGDKAKTLLCGGYSAACETIRQRFVKAGQYHTAPQVGDLIFFRGTRHSGANHIGIVWQVDKSFVYTIEGNTSVKSGVVDNGGGVAQKLYKLTYSSIMGYGRPMYSAGIANEAQGGTIAQKASTAKKASDYIAEVAKKMTTLKKGSKGKAVKVWQTILGNVTVDGDFGAKTHAATVAWQKAHGLTADGIVGQYTWTAGLKSL